MSELSFDQIVLSRREAAFLKKLQKRPAHRCRRNTDLKRLLSLGLVLDGDTLSSTVPGFQVGEYAIITTPRGTSYLAYRKQQSRQTVFANTVSVIALIVSIAALIVSIVTAQEGTSQ